MLESDHSGIEIYVDSHRKQYEHNRLESDHSGIEIF